MARSKSKFTKLSSLSPEWAIAVLTDEDRGQWNSSPQMELKKLTELFSLGSELLGEYLNELSTKDLNDGLWNVVGSSGLLNHLFDQGVDNQTKVDCIASIRFLFFDLFSQRCRPVLSHGLKTYPEDFEPLNSICYMWWDLFPTWGSPDSTATKTIDSAILEVLNEILHSENISCVESALHGLGHWHLNYAEETELIIDRFLKETNPAKLSKLSGGDLSVENKLRDYAKAARIGCVN